ncbi:MAG: PEP-CTERM sorting domain-containing protein [Spirochaetaceae bacterium]|nr:PEP-CTERM sorting domain-containing protein [Myxococcales bacterium]MCB9724924.1 PEP-CTERM sorting domain-containing protein [Spirochaetaceae bacterium]
MTNDVQTLPFGWLISGRIVIHQHAGKGTARNARVQRDLFGCWRFGSMSLRMGSWLVVSAVYVLLGAGAAQAVSLTFDHYALPPASSIQIGNGLALDGYLLDAPAGELFIDAAGYPDRPDNGTPTLVARRQGLDSVDLRLASLTGNFDLLQVDLAELFNPGAGNPLFTALSIDVTGLLDGGGSVQRQITLDGISDGPGGVADFETFVFDASWTNLTQVVFHGVRPGSTLPHIKIDNIEVQAAVVPEPSTAMLVLLGLMGLGASRRDRMGVDGAPSRIGS